jgi:tripartite-type tricarboxylate transporter receptor subunit TctC
MGELETLLWRAILGPEGLDPAIVEQLGAVIEAAVNDPSYVEFLATKGEVPNVVLGEDLGVRLQAEFDALAEVSAGLGL